MPGLDRAAAAQAAARWFWLPAGASRVETDRYLVVRYPDRITHPLQLLRVVPGPDGPDVGALVDEVLEQLRGGEVDRLLCWVRLDAPEGLEETLLARGAALDETADVLARPVTPAHLPDLHEPGPGDGLTLRWVDDLETYRWCDDVGRAVFGGGRPSDADLERDLPAEREKLRTGRGGALVALLDGEPVGTGGVTVAPGDTGADARLWSGSVLPHARGRGVYRALLAARLRFAVEHGADLALVKGRVETSAPILRRAGFETVGQERSYLLPLG